MSGITKAEYLELFCKGDKIEDRYAIYVSKKTHRRIRMALSATTGVSISSFVDTIVNHHIDEFKEVIKELAKEDYEKFMQIFKTK